jgi:hypothetical protein
VTNVFKGFAAACGLAALSVAGVSGAAQAYVNVQTDPVGELVDVIEAALANITPCDNALAVQPANCASESDIAAIIQAAIAGSDPLIASQALTVVANNSNNTAVSNAANGVASGMGTGGTPATAGAGGQGGTTAAGAPPFGGSGGGNSDY